MIKTTSTPTSIARQIAAKVNQDAWRDLRAEVALFETPAFSITVPQPDGSQEEFIVEVRSTKVDRTTVIATLDGVVCWHALCGSQDEAEAAAVAWLHDSDGFGDEIDGVVCEQPEIDFDDLVTSLGDPYTFTFLS